MAMDVQNIRSAMLSFPSQTTQPVIPPSSVKKEDEQETQQAFQDFVGQTFYGQMLSAMRKTVGKPAYFHGGQAEEIFRGQLDQVLSEKLSDATAASFSEPLYELFTLSRS